MLTFFIISFCTIVVLFVMGAFSDEADITAGSFLFGLFLFFLFAGAIAESGKRASIKHIEGKPVYEKLYQVDQSGEIVDSTYVVINTKSK